jgi:uncharacterized protein YhaN
MGIGIDRINIDQAGPVSGLQLTLRRFNLIYGLNEKGKTFLVEFVVRSLFGNLSGWSLRDADFRGKVIVSGLADSPVTFMPSSGDKLEGALVEQVAGMPANISNLLVVKGADLSFGGGRRPGISKVILKDLLSGQGVLDDVQKNITKTVMNSTIEEGRIVGSTAGEIKNSRNLKRDLEQIDDLFNQIENTYSGGERQVLQSRIDELKEAISELEAAKGYLAFQINQRLQKQKEQLEQLPGEDLDQLKDEYVKLERTENDITRLETRLARLEQESEQYEWLDEAIVQYEQRGVQEAVGPSLVYPALIIAALLLAIGSSFAGFPLGTAVLLVIAAFFGGLYVRQYRSALEQAVDADESKKLEEEFERRFGEPLSGLPQLKEKKKSMEEAYHSSKTVRGDLQDEMNELEELQDQLALEFKRLLDRTPERDSWDSEIRDLVDQRKRMDAQFGQYRLELAALNVPESEYRSEPVSMDYSKEKLEGLRRELEQAEESLRSDTDALINLKHSIGGLTGESIDVELEMLIESLQQKREEISAEYRDVTAKIIAGILVNDQLDVIRTQEEENIRKKLVSSLVTTPIQSITKRYSGVLYEDGQVWVTDDFGSFALSDLSTGALEQVLLGLRLGFAAHIFKQKSLFLLLDDAFQHADWQRREWLLDQMVTIAKGGWQIIYFTMDEHIKGLFEEAGEEHFPGQYMSYNLNEKELTPPGVG